MLPYLSILSGMLSLPIGAFATPFWTVSVALGFLLLILRNVELSLDKSYYILILSTYLVVSCTSILFSQEIAHVFHRSFTLFALFLLFVVSICAEPNSHQRQIRAYIVVSVIFSLLALADYPLLIFVPDVYYLIHYFEDTGGFKPLQLGGYGDLLRLRGFFPEANEFAAHIIFPLLLCYGAMIRKLRVFNKRKTLAGFALVMAFALTLTISRGGILALLVGILFLHVLELVKSELRQFFKVTLSITCLLIIFDVLIINYFFNTSFVLVFIDRLFSIFTGMLNDYSANQRLITSSTALNFLAENPQRTLIGFGFGSLQYSAVQQATTTNSAIDILFETGLFGILCFYILPVLLVTHYVSVRIKIRSDNYALLFGDVLFATLVSYLFLSIFYATHNLPIYYFILGSLAAISSTSTRIKRT